MCVHRKHGSGLISKALSGFGGSMRWKRMGWVHYRVMDDAGVVIEWHVVYACYV